MLWALIAGVTACDSGGRVLEDLRLARLKEGQSTEQDVRAVFGSPQAVRDVAGVGKGYVYLLGPEGAHTLLLKIGRVGLQAGVLRTAVKIPRRMSSGRGGQPGTATSTGITLATLPQLA